MSSFSIDTRSMSSSPLVNSLVKSRLFKTAPDIDEPPFQFIHSMDLSVVDAMLHDSSVHRTEIWAIWRLGPKTFGVSWRSSSTVARARRGVPVHCPLTLLELKVVTRRTAYRWHQYDVIVMSWSSIEEYSKRYHRISCFVTIMKLQHALQIYSTVFVKQCMRLNF